jgi:hypothetical protein
VQKELTKFDYIGWIPTIAGKLYFKHIVCSKSLTDAQSVSINHIDSNLRRYITLSTSVDWKDCRDKEKDGLFRVVALADMAIKEYELDGHVYIYPCEKTHNNSTWSTIGDDIRDELGLSLAGEDVESQYKKISSHLSGFSDLEFYKVSFKILRHGFCLIKFDADNANNVSNESRHIICRQAFYFLKYSIHQHQHHSDSDDSLTTIHSASEKDIAICMIDDLKKGLVRVKRDFQNLGHYCLFDAKGIISYACSLVEACREVGFIDEKNYNSQLSYLKNMSDSLHNIAENAERRISKKSVVSNSYRSMVLLFLSIFMPVSIIFREEIIDNLSQHNQGWLIAGISKFYSDSVLFVLFWSFVVILYYVSMRVIDKHGDLRILGIKATVFLQPIVYSARKAKILWVTALILCIALFLYSLIDIVT